MSKNKAKKIAKLYATILKENKISFSDVYLFGSYSRNTQRKGSDIDVMVVAKSIPDYIKYKQKLWRLTRQVDTRIEPHACNIRDFNNGLSPLSVAIKKSGVKVA